MPAERGEVWQIDFGMAAKVRPALLLTGEPAEDELDLFTVLLHTTALRGNRWELAIAKPFLKPGGSPPAAVAECVRREAPAPTRDAYHW